MFNLLEKNTIYNMVCNVILCKYRCEALNFELSKSQKKIIKKVTKFLKNGEYDKSSMNFEQVEREPQMKYELHGNCILFYI